MLKPFPQPPPKTVRDRPEHHLNSEAMDVFQISKKRDQRIGEPEDTIECGMRNFSVAKQYIPELIPCRFYPSGSIYPHPTWRKI
jgi:hypothetical protein